MRVGTLQRPTRFQPRHHVEKPPLGMTESAVLTAHQWLGAEGHSNVEPPPDFDTEELRRSDAYDLKRGSIERDRLTDDGRIAGVAAFPEGMTQHGTGRPATLSI